MRNSLFLTFCFTLILSFSFASNANAQAMHGVFRVVKGNVQVKSGKNGAMTRARVGLKVFPQDAIVAGPDSRAKIVMVDNNEINVSPDSQVVFEKYEGQPNAPKREVLLNVIYGKVRSKVEQKYDGKTSKFQIKTPSAVAGVRGTDFLTSYDQGSKQTNIVTFEGKVELGSLGANGQIVNSVGVGVGQTASMAPGAPPTPPQLMPESDLKAASVDSNAETGGSAESGESRTPASSNSGDKGEKKETGAPKEGREPSSTRPTVPPPPPPPLPPSALPMPPVFEPPQIPEIPVCDFCNRVIENGNSQVTIKVNR